MNGGKAFSVRGISITLQRPCNEGRSQLLDQDLGLLRVCLGWYWSVPPQVWQQHVTSFCLHASPDYKPSEPLRDIYQQWLSVVQVSEEGNSGLCARGKYTALLHGEKWEKRNTDCHSFCTNATLQSSTDWHPRVLHTQQCPSVSINMNYSCTTDAISTPVRLYLFRRETVQKLADMVVIVSFPRAACPAHAVLPARWAFSSSFQVLQAAPHLPKNLQGLGVSMAESPLHKLCITTGNSASFDLMTDTQHTEGDNHEM